MTTKLTAHKLLCALAVLYVLSPLQANAQGTVQAWRQVVGISQGMPEPGGSWSSDWEQTRGSYHGVDVDISGNAYVLWFQEMIDPATGGAVESSYLSRFNAAGVRQFTYTIGRYPISYAPNCFGVYVAPLIGGQQYVYVVMGEAPTEFNVLSGNLWVYKFNTAGHMVWPARAVVDLSTKYFCQFAGFYPGADDHAYIAFDSATTNTTESVFRMVTLDSNGQILADHENPNIWPEGLGYQLAFADQPSAKFEPIRHRWVAIGWDPHLTTIFNVPPVHWGVYDPDTGAQDYGETVSDFINTTTNTAYRFRYNVEVLPGGNLAVITNMAQKPAGSSMEPTPYHNIRVLGPDNELKWRYPHGDASGWGNHVVSFNMNSPIYFSGYPFITETLGNGTTFTQAESFMPQWLERFGWDGVPLSHANNQPAFFMIPSPEGFYSFTNDDANPYPNTTRLLFNHFTGGNADFQMIYAEPTPDINSLYEGPGQLSGFASYSDPTNSYGYALIYLPHHLDDNGHTVDGQYPALVLDRFATGLELSSLVAPASVRQMHACAVSISLTGPATGAGYIVGLISNSSKLLMPNGTRSQNFRIMPGQKSINVTLNAGAVIATTNVSLLATQNNVRRDATVAVTP